MCDPPRAEHLLCSFCLMNVVVHCREPTIFGSADVCDECLRNYRQQLSWVVHELSRQPPDDLPVRKEALLTDFVKEVFPGTLLRAKDSAVGIQREVR